MIHRSLFLLLVCAACSGGRTSAIAPTSTSSSTVSTADTGAPAMVEEQIAAGPEPIQDILFVVDNSCSMEADQYQMNVDSWAFFQHLSASSVDWHVGITSTDAGLGSRACEQGPAPLAGALVQNGGTSWIDSTVAQPEVDFGQRIALGTTGSGCEMGMASAYLALEASPTAGFLRDGSAVHIVIVSDEQDQSEDWGANLVSIGEFKDWLEALRPHTTFSSFVCTESQGGYDDCPRENVGSRYIDVTNTIGGLTWDIVTNTQYLAPFDQLGAAIVAPRAAYALAGTPDATTLVVELDRAGTIVAIDPSAYTYDVASNSIVFNDPATALMPGDVVVVRFTPAS